MKIIDIIKNKKITFSIEIFPNIAGQDVSKAINLVEQLKVLNPDFVSVTYGAGGTTREKTVYVADKIQNNLQIPTVAHLTCISATTDSISKTLDELKSKGIKNIMALRGDIPKDDSQPFKDFRYAVDLVKFIKKRWDFCVGVAGYPEKHPESESLEKDIEYLKQKIDAGADYVVTQIFLNNEHFYNFKNKIFNSGIKVPVIPGIMTAIKISNLKKILTLCEIEVPEKFSKIMSNCEKDELCEENIKYVIEQINNLLDNGVSNIHLYTMNKIEQNKRIYYDSKISKLR
ncbi:MAG: methylenetetrahydrofolate reductase [NAD(P)H] [Endomicrobiia bacterium]